MTRRDPKPAELTAFLDALRDGGAPEAEEALMPHLYAELRRIAEACMRDQRPNHTLQPTALVSEAYLKLFQRSEADWNDRKHFFALAARAMRQLLVDHARSRGRVKRGGGAEAVTLDVAVAAAGGIDHDVLDLDEALCELAELDEQQARVVELRTFAGLEMAQIAEVLGVSLSTVEREWRASRAWLGVRLGGGAGA